MTGYFENERAEMHALLPAPPYLRTLEVGCASGVFSASLASGERWGIEPVETAAEQARSRGLKVLRGVYADLEHQLPDGHFDLIIANDVIEHMPDHEQFLRAVSRKLSPKGRLVLSVPNIRSLATLLRLVILKDWKYVPEGVLDRTHLRFFTERSLRRCLNECGYEIESLVGLRSIFRIDPGISMSKALVNWAVAAAVVALTLGHALDTRFLQFGVRVRRRRPAASLEERFDGGGA